MLVFSAPPFTGNYFTCVKCIIITCIIPSSPTSVSAPLVGNVSCWVSHPSHPSLDPDPQLLPF